jgi:uncharacterized membrane protein YfcA
MLLLLLAIFAIGFAVGVLGNISGIGGGVMIVLVLVYGYGFKPLEAAGLSLLTIVFSTFVGFVQDTRKGLVDRKLLLIIAPIGVVASVIGSVITNYVSTDTFKLFFALILIALGMFSIHSTRKQKGHNSKIEEASTAHTRGTGLVAIISGVISGFIGIGIGGIMGTFLTAIKKINAKTAIATVVAATLPITVMGASVHFYLSGTISLTFAPPLIVGAVLGGLAGTSIIVKAPHISLRFMQGYVIIFFGGLSVLLFIISSLVH